MTAPLLPPLLLRALRGEPVPRPPIWFMRQAGRYLPEYRAVRERVSFLELCRDADLCAEVALQPIRRFGFDAGIVFSDILLVLEKMGAPIAFGDGDGPRIPNPIRDRAGVRALHAVDPVRDLPAPLLALRTCVRATGVPFFGFAGAPFTLACYLVEGRGSETWEATRAFLKGDPDAFRDLLSRLADAAGDLLQAQVEAGAAAVQLFDTWAGILAPEDWRRFALPATRRALDRVRGAPRLYFARDCGPFLPWLVETGADAFGLDWKLDLATARRALGTVPVQGNLDPTALFASPAEVADRVAATIRAAGPLGHVFNLGHGIAPATPIAGVEAAVAAVKKWSWA